jgi:hypothetical protein
VGASRDGTCFVGTAQNQYRISIKQCRSSKEFASHFGIRNSLFSVLDSGQLETEPQSYPTHAGRVLHTGSIIPADLHLDGAAFNVVALCLWLRLCIRIYARKLPA